MSQTVAMKLRPLRWPADADALRDLPAAYSTSAIFVPEVDGLGVRLRETRLRVPFAKTYPAETLLEAAATASFAVVAEAAAGGLAGFTAVQLRPWNRSAELSALFVAPDSRGQGLGRALMLAAIEFARGERVRCLTLETQCTNAPAIRFYQRAGFQFCGVHTALYDPATVAPEEAAVFFTYPLDAVGG
ncbi:GNAT family N-acetyltransferase [Nannocystis bainbridge]|uniref:GNAT family N-acetyltransferase n=1 Tax=Nannocystis bainbridge TaxID=2995303 RepID=A0ABT5DQG6_9BACT|nr:GNAT family N-acetyltransferase [Nannocystis bainbridge]MDC0715902.1 GNAT family N-acetyltransferase [Nannocystis bainbridge]